MTRFLTIEQSIRENAYRHESKGLWWTELGFDDRAKGSFKKALKNHQKADMFKIPEFYVSIYKNWDKLVARSILGID